MSESPVPEGHIRIRVTADHINPGVRADPFMCPIARGFLEVKGVYQAMVFHDRVRVFKGSNHGGWVTIDCPPGLTAIIAEFDLTQKMSPFMMDIPCLVLA